MASNKVTVAVSKRNYNRVKFGTHQLAYVLKLEGHQIATNTRYVQERMGTDFHGQPIIHQRPVVESVGVIMGDQTIPFKRIELTPRRKAVGLPQAAPIRVETVADEQTA